MNQTQHNTYTGAFLLAKVGILAPPSTRNDFVPDDFASHDELDGMPEDRAEAARAYRLGDWYALGVIHGQQYTDRQKGLHWVWSSMRGQRSAPQGKREARIAIELGNVGKVRTHTPTQIAHKHSLEMWGLNK